MDVRAVTSHAFVQDNACQVLENVVKNIYHVSGKEPAFLYFTDPPLNYSTLVIGQLSSPYKLAEEQIDFFFFHGHRVCPEGKTAPTLVSMFPQGWYQVHHPIPFGSHWAFYCVLFFRLKSRHGMLTFEEEEAVETTLQNLSTQLVCVSIWGRFPKTLLQVRKEKKCVWFNIAKRSLDLCWMYVFLDVPKS